MHPMVARAFLNKLLKDYEKADLRRIEKNLVPGRYLQGYEICRRFNMKPEPFQDSETMKMEALWGQYATTKLNEGRAQEERIGATPKTRAQEVHEWEEWADAHYE